MVNRLSHGCYNHADAFALFDLLISDVNKDWTCKGKDKDKDQAHKDQDKDKD